MPARATAGGGSKIEYTRRDIQDAVNRAGEAHMDALIDHHESAYPESRPTPGDVCRAEAERLNELGFGDLEGELELAETRVERVGDRVRVTHAFRHPGLKTLLLTEPFTGYD